MGLNPRIHDALKNLVESTIVSNFLSATRKKIVGSSNPMEEVPTCNRNISLSKENRYALQPGMWKRLFFKRFRFRFH